VGQAEELNDRTHQRGDIALFDFAGWYRKPDEAAPDFTPQKERLQRLLMHIR